MLSSCQKVRNKQGRSYENGLGGRSWLDGRCHFTCVCVVKSTRGERGKTATNSLFLPRLIPLKAMAGRDSTPSEVREGSRSKRLL